MTDVNFSTLFLLTTSIDGLIFLNTLFNNYPDIGRSIPALAWTAHSSFNPNMNDISPLLGVLINGSMLGLVDTIIKLKNSGFDDISSKDWQALLTSKLSSENDELFLSALKDGNARRKVVDCMRGRYPRFAKAWSNSCDIISSNVIQESPAVFFKSKAVKLEKAYVRSVCEVGPGISSAP